MTYQREKMLKRYIETRTASIAMCAPLEPEQCRIQPVVEVSPPWWNLGHTSWFFVRNILLPFGGGTAKEDELFDYVLNSYYVSLGPRVERSRRGLMARPTMKEVHDYRKSVDQRMEALIPSLNESQWIKCAPLIEIGIQHEQQHQELFYTEIKFILYQTPRALRPTYLQQVSSIAKNKKTSAISFIDFAGGLYEFGNLEGGWGWDNEEPVHKYYLDNFSLQNRLITNGEYLEFIEDGGYEQPLLWLDNGWTKVSEHGWKAPLYWESVDGSWDVWTLSGMQPLCLNEPVCHVSFYEAEAYATWKGGRLPSEREWEFAARSTDASAADGNFLDSGLLHPKPARNSTDLTQMLGDVWEWTTSYYEPYPGFKPYKGALSEYNEKFMDNQRVIRGGSCVTERNHIRISYRNFWPPDTRFQFTGIRLSGL